MEPINNEPARRLSQQKDTETTSQQQTNISASDPIGAEESARGVGEKNYPRKWADPQLFVKGLGASAFSKPARSYRTMIKMVEAAIRSDSNKGRSPEEVRAQVLAEAEARARAAAERDKPAERRQQVTNQTLPAILAEIDEAQSKTSDMHSLVIEAAIRRTKEYGRRLNMTLRLTTQGPPTNRHFIVAHAEKVVLDRKPAVIRYIHEDFALKKDDTLQWVYDHPFRAAIDQQQETGRSASGTSESNVLEALFGRREWTHKIVGGIKVKDTCTWVTQGAIKRLQPKEYFGELIADSWAELRHRCGLGFGDVVLLFDGSKIHINKEQRQGTCPEDEDSLRGLMKDCAFGYHQNTDGWRGYNDLTICDLGLGKPAAMELIPANKSDHQSVRALALKFHVQAERAMARLGLDPDDLEVNYWVGDSAFCRRDTCYQALFCFGAVPVFGWRKDNAKHADPWADNRGVPQCSCNARTKDMRYHAFEGLNLLCKEGRRKYGLQPGEDILPKLREDKDVDKLPRIAFKCPECGTKKRKWVHDAPHIYAYAPYKDVHKENGKDAERDRYLLREDLLNSRNTAETHNGLLKARGAAPTGPLKPKWVKCKEHLEFLLYGRTWAINMQLLVMINGDLATAWKEIRSLGLHRPDGLQEQEPEAEQDQIDDGESVAA